MSKDEVIEFCKNQIEQSIALHSVENSKVEFKSKWYDLNIEEEKFEFIKDLASIVNSIGADGFLIIGFDEKKKTFIDSHFTIVGKRDDELLGIIKSNVDRPFNFEFHDFVYNKNKLCVIHTFPSLEKPHVIKMFKSNGKNFPNEIFIRRVTSNERASKADLDLMYAEKNTIVIERDIRVSVIKSSMKFEVDQAKVDGKVKDVAKCKFDVILHNRGIEEIYVLRSSIFLFEENMEFRFFTNIPIHLAPGKIYRGNHPISFTYLPRYITESIPEFVALLNSKLRHRIEIKLNSMSLSLSDGSSFTTSITIIDKI